MASFQGGTFSGYESISPYRLYLDLSFDDLEFKTSDPNPLFITETSNYLQPFQNYPVVGNFSNPKLTIWDVLKSDTRTKDFSKLLEGYRLQNYLNNDGTRWNISEQITAFIPVNGIKDILYSIDTLPLRMENILQYHLINYYIQPVQLFNRINRIETLLKSQYLTIAGTAKDLYILKDNDRTYRNKILQTLKTDIGIIYFIEKPLIPYLY